MDRYTSTSTRCTTSFRRRLDWCVEGCRPLEDQFLTSTTSTLQAAEYAHPLEVLILGAGTIGGPLLYCLARPDLHIFTVYCWVTLRLFQAVDAHSGYDFPWSLNKIIPFWSGADHHDFHHMVRVLEGARRG